MGLPAPTSTMQIIPLIRADHGPRTGQGTASNY
jgi:hypothetical protein